MDKGTISHIFRKFITNGSAMDLLKPEVFKKFQENFISVSKILEEQSKKIKADLVEVGSKYTEVVELLATYGWFIIPVSFPRLDFDTAYKIKDGKIEEADRIMINHIEGHLDYIVRDVIEDNPERNEVLTAALNAHKRKEYLLSVPIFLIQSDGICKKATSKNLFGGKKNKEGKYVPHTRSWAEEQLKADSFLNMLLNPLINKYSFNEANSEINPLGVSRHDILHGSSIAYGSQVISCKSLSLLSYINWVTFPK